MYVWLLLISFSALLLLFRKKPGRKRASIVVLGDIGRSPRMQYHALSFVRHGFEVTIHGYGGSIPHGDLVGNPQIKFSLMREPPSFIRKFPKIVGYLLKTVWQFISLFFTMMFSCKAGYILLQNPPAIPTMAVCWLVSLLRGSKFIIDWHNYGFTVLGMTLGARNPLTRVSKIYEKILGRFSSANICVTKAMKADLLDNWGVVADTMYDRPPTMFKRLDIEEQHSLFIKLANTYPEFKSASGSSCFTEVTESGSAVCLKNRPALLISSTSWTEDEDFSILLNALERYEESKAVDDTLPSLVCAITGKGPQKDYYKHIIANKQWKHVNICTPWLEAEDYPKLLGSADIGVCMHTSTSGLDLPMKVVDMFGCGLPVCAIHFKCLDELVKHRHNGLVFRSDAELAEQLQDLLRAFPDGGNDLKTFRENLKEFQKIRWDETWDEIVLPLLS